MSDQNNEHTRPLVEELGSESESESEQSSAMSDQNNEHTTPLVEEPESDSESEQSSAAAKPDATGHDNKLQVRRHPVQCTQTAATPDATGHGNNKSTEAHHTSKQSRVNFMRVDGGSFSYNEHVEHHHHVQPAGGATDPKLQTNMEKLFVGQQEIKEKLQTAGNDKPDQDLGKIMADGFQDVLSGQEKIKEKMSENTAGNEANPGLKKVNNKVNKVLRQQQELKKDVAKASQQNKTDQTGRDDLKQAADQLVETAEKLSDTLKNVPVSKHTRPSPEMQDVFRANYQTLIDHMKINEVLPLLFQNSKIDSDDKQGIQALPTFREQITYLLNTLTKKENVRDMIEALRATRQDVLADLLAKPKETTV